MTSGDVVSPHYDPMLAKVISVAPTREAATRALAATLARARIHGITTNRDLLVRILNHPAFRAGDTDTGFFERHGLAALAEPLADKSTVALSVLAAALADAAANRARASVLSRIPSGWRNVVSAPQTKRFRLGDTEHEVRYRLTRGGLVIEDMPGVRLIKASPDAVELEIDGLRRRFELSSYSAQWYVDSTGGSVALTRLERYSDPAAQVAAGSLLAPMPGTVVRVTVGEGDRVSAGQPLLWLEAMKMQHQINAPADGVVTSLAVAAGDQVDVGRILAVVEEEGS